MSLAGPLLVWGLSICLAGCTEEAPETPFQLKVLYTINGIGDRSFADSVYEGVVRAGLLCEFYTEPAAPSDVAEAASIFEGWVSETAEKRSMILTVGQSYTAFLRERGCDFGGHNLVHLDDELPECPGGRSVLFRTYAPAFLAGVAAMAVSSKKKAAAIGGMELPTVYNFIDGFSDGVAYAGGEIVDVVYLSDTVDGFSNQELAFEAALELFEQVDVIMPVAGGSNLGVYEAAKLSEGRYTFGVDTDQSSLGRGVIVGSVVKRMDRVVEQILLSFAKGRFLGGKTSIGLSEQGTALVLGAPFVTIVGSAVEAARKDAVAAARAYYGETP